MHRYAGSPDFPLIAKEVKGEGLIMKFFLKYKIIAIPGLIFILILILHYTNIIAPAENLLRRLFNPAEKIIYEKSLTLSETMANLKIPKPQLLQKIKEQEIEILNLTYENQQLKNLQEENKKLRQLLNFQEIIKQKIILADIIAKSSLSASRTFNLNQGEKNGILKDQAVIVGAGVIIGKILAVEKNSSIVLLLTDNNSRLAVSLEGETISGGILRGNQGLSLILDFAPLDAVLKPKQKILTAGAEPGIPQGLIAGEIESLIPAEDSLFQTAVVKPMIDYDKLTVVGVVK